MTEPTPDGALDAATDLPAGHELEDLVDTWHGLGGNWLLRYRGNRHAPELRDGDVLTVRTADTAAPGQLVIASHGDNLYSPERYEHGMTVVGVIAGLMRRIEETT